MKTIITKIVMGLNADEARTALINAITYGKAYEHEVAVAILNSLEDTLRDRQSWFDECEAFYADNKRVAGIKVCREATGWGLREAKDYCDLHFGDTE